MRVWALTVVSLACATSAPLHVNEPAGLWHRLAPGETLPEIARQSGVPLEDLLEINGLHRPEDAVTGQMIFVLQPKRPPEQPPASPRMQTLARPGQPGEPGERAGPVRTPKLAEAPILRWPIEPPILASPFGFRDGRAHEGIDLSAPIGTPVRAARAGQVVYAGDAVKGYGLMVVLQHDDQLLTVYAHNSLLLVKEGQTVAAGEEIARVGQSGRATAPHLHFEVRRGEIPQDPLRFLPPLKKR